LEDGGGDEQHGELEVDATTEHYYAVHIPTNTNNVRFNNFKIQSSGPTQNADGDTPRIGHVRVSSTPKYRDYFAEVNSPTGASGSDNTDNLNHLYVTRGGVKGDGPTVTVTKTIVPEGMSPTTPTYNITNVEYQIPSPIPANNFFNSHDENTTTTRATPTLPPNDNSPSNNNVSPQVSNSVEESNHSQSENGTLELHPTSAPKVTSKEATTVFYTKVEEPHFTSSSYEFSTTKEYSYGTNHSYDEHHDDDEDDDHHHHDHPEHAEESQHGNATNSPPSPTITPNGTFTTSKTFTTSAATASSSQVPVVLSSPNPTSGQENFPEISHNDISEENQSQEKNESNKKEKDPLTKGLPSVNVPVMYQVPVLVKMEVEVPQKMFCSHLTHFKQMIVMIYGTNKQR
jgi:hypothetical protein